MPPLSSQAASNNLILTWLSRARMLLGCAFCASFTWLIVWYSHRPGSWSMNHDVAKLALLCFAPLSVLMWSLLPALGDHRRNYRLTCRLILLYVALALIIAVAMGEIGWIIPAAVGTLVGLILMGLGPWRISSPDGLGFYRKSLLLSNGAVIVGLLIWSFANIGFATRDAAKLAAEKPSCIQVAKGFGGYEEADRLLDLRGLSMYAPQNDDGLHYSFHAVLVVQSDQGLEWYNWSYRRMKFMPIAQRDLESAVIGMREPRCALRLHFVRALPLFR